MASKELDFQKELIDAVEGVGGYGIKMSNRFMIGIPDLFLVLMKQVLIVECKFLNIKRGKPLPIKLPLKLTPKQKAVMNRMDNAGVNIGWCYCIKFDNKWNAICGVNTNIKGFPPEVLWSRGVERRIGENWDVESLFKPILGGFDIV